MRTDKLNILENALSQMPKFFTSTQFGVKVRQLGGDLSYGKTGLITNYLNCKAKKLGSQRWERFENVSAIIKSSDVYNALDRSDVNNAIDLLKSHGYKIYKTIEI